MKKRKKKHLTNLPTSKFTNSTGFTLIELLITISIIGIFSGVIFASLNGSRARSRDAVRLGDLKSLSLATENYFAEHSSFPDNIALLDEYFGDKSAGSAPKDPQTHTTYSYLKLSHGYCFAAIVETPIPNPAEGDLDCPEEIGGNYIIKGP